jgi:4-amino-4-deoxy-L-arabinose transferase-like glycosyltransferase
MNVTETLRLEHASPTLGERALKLLAAVGAGVGIAIIGIGQYYVMKRRSPFDWPWTGRLADEFEKAFHVQTSLAFGVPLFLLGGLIFALAAPRIAHYWRPREAAALAWSRPGIVVGAVITLATLVWLWLNYSLWRDDDPIRSHGWVLHLNARWLAAVFVACILALTAALGAWDIRRTRPRWPRLRTSHALEALAVLAIVGTFIGINVRDLADWRYAAIGDEGTFWDVAQRLLHEPEIDWFSQRSGPFGVQPALGSAWHAANMMVFGEDQFGWRIGSLTSVVVVLPVFYWLIRQMLGVRIALFATLFLGASHYLFGYAHTGYNNLFPLFPTVAALALLIAGVRWQSVALLFLCGIWAGLGFHTYYSSRMVIGLVGLAVLIMGWKHIRPMTIAPIGAGFIVAALPLFASDGWYVIDAMDERAITHSPEPVVEHMIYNTIRTLLAFNFSSDNAHYTAGALLDAFTATLMVAGLIFAFVNLRQFPHAVLLLWAGLAAFTTGVMSEYSIVSISRLHYILPPLVVFAAIALDRLIAMASDLINRPRQEWLLTGATLAVIAPVVFIVNGKHFFEFSASRHPTIAETVILREFKDTACRDSELRNFVAMPAPDPVLLFLWHFFGMKDEKPVMVAYRDAESTYLPYPSGGTGCVAAAHPQAAESDLVTQRYKLVAAAGGPTFSVETDVTGQTQVLVAPEVKSRLDERALAANWRTDFSRGDGVAGVVQGQEKDGLPGIDDPEFVPAREARPHPHEPTLHVEINGERRAYLARIIRPHGVLNDVVGGVPIAVSYDPMAGTLRAYERRVGDRELTFSTTGMLRGGNALLYDRETETWWQQVSGRAVTGELAGETLTPVAGHFVGASEVVIAMPDVPMLLEPAVDDPKYLFNPYLAYDLPTAKPIFRTDAPDARLPAMKRVAVIDVNGDRVAVAYPDVPEYRYRAQTVQVGGEDVVLLFDWRTVSMLDTRGLADSRPVGSFTAFRSRARGEAIHIEAPEGFVDRETGSAWTLLGGAVAGEYTGEQLEPVLAISGFWHAVSSAYPDIEIAGD